MQEARIKTKPSKKDKQQTTRSIIQRELSSRAHCEANVATRFESELKAVMHV